MAPLRRTPLPRSRPQPRKQVEAGAGDATESPRRRTAAAAERARYPRSVTGRLPATVTGFLRERIGSVEQLEVLLLLREDGSRSWSVGELSGHLRSAEASVAMRLDLLTLDRLAVGQDGRYRYADGPHEYVVEEVSRCFRSRRAAVIETIFSGDGDPDPL